MQTPSERLIAAGNASSEILDTRGRKISVRRLNALDRLRLYKAAGPALASNPGWMGIATLAYAVCAIDDVPVPSPAVESQVEAVVARLGDDGIAAVAAAVAALAADGTRVDAKN